MSAEFDPAAGAVFVVAMFRSFCCVMYRFTVGFMAVFVDEVDCLLRS
jgi:hypothetical protein